MPWGWTPQNIQPNGGDTQSRNLYKKLVQVDLYKTLDRLTWFLVQYFSCTEYSTALFHTRNLHARD